jgi:hypothetical protein
MKFEISLLFFSNEIILLNKNSLSVPSRKITYKESVIIHLNKTALLVLSVSFIDKYKIR